MSVELQYTQMHNKQDLSDLSPIALEQLRFLASTVNDAQIKMRAAAHPQKEYAQKRQDLLHRLNSSRLSLQALEARRNPPEQEIAQQLSEIADIERDIAKAEVHLRAVREIREGFAVWLSPSVRVLDRLMETLGTSASELFPELPTDASFMPGGH